MEDMEAALKASMALIDQYSPLEAARLQTAKSTGNVSVSVPGADNRVRITIKNYLKPGDVVVTLGAGDIWKVGEQLLKALQEGEAA
jgi:UDP-N-acetylmuramate--alanine ligase